MSILNSFFLLNFEDTKLDSKLVLLILPTDDIYAYELFFLGHLKRKFFLELDILSHFEIHALRQVSLFFKYLMTLEFVLINIREYRTTDIIGSKICEFSYFFFILSRTI